MDLKDAQCSEVWPDRAPNCFSTDPPDHDQFSDKKCLSSTLPVGDSLTRGIKIHASSRATHNNLSSLAKFARAHESDKLPHEAELWSTAEVDLRDVQYSEVLPDTAPNCLITDPPKPVQFSDTECLSSTPHVCNSLTGDMKIHATRVKLLQY